MGSHRMVVARRNKLGSRLAADALVPADLSFSGSALSAVSLARLRKTLGAMA